eukprot:1487155-Pyramimonas_sp.AAC.1
MADWAERHTMVSGWQILVAKIRARALEYFEAKKSPIDLEYQQLANQRRQALRDRTLARQNLTEDLESTLILRRCSAACKKLRRRLRDLRDEQHFHELQQADETGLEAEVWKTCRKLA